MSEWWKLWGCCGWILLPALGTALSFAALLLLAQNNPTAFIPPSGPIHWIAFTCCLVGAAACFWGVSQLR